MKTMPSYTTNGFECGRLCGNRRGVALVIVLGLLALMVLMGVTFAIYMRTERVAAGNYRNDVQARQLLQVALNRALQGIDASLSTNLYPGWFYLVSTNGPYITAVTNDPVMNWIPLAAMGTNPNPRPQWIEESFAGKVGGRVGYLVVNCSGLLDANHSGGWPSDQRLCGTNAAEIQLGGLVEVADETKIDSTRTNETLQEFGVRGRQNGTLDGTPQHFVTYSAFPTGALTYVGGDVGSLVTNESTIIADFIKVGVPATQAGILFTNLCDYVDSDVIPGNLGGAVPAAPDGPSVEPVWMFNEVRVSNTVVFISNVTNYTVSGQWFIDGEVWFPFVGNPAPTRTNFSLTMQIEFTNSLGSADYCPSNNPMTITAQIVPDVAAPDFAVITRRGPIKGGGVFALPACPFDLIAKITATISNSTDLVDSIPTITLTSTVSQLTTAGIRTQGAGSDDRECEDARLNYRLDRWKGPANNVSTLKAINTNSWLLMANDWRDGDWAMFVRNHALETPGELGYLFFGNAAETLRLYDHGATGRGKLHPVFDVFTTEVNGGGVIKGLVNVNTRNAEVMDCVFTNLPLDYPHGDKTNRVGGVLLTDITDSIMVYRQTAEFKSLSELGRVPWRAVLPNGSDLDRESILRNSVGLLHARQNLFTIVLYAQTTKAVALMPDKSVVSGVRAIAEVWRDPVGLPGQHQYLVRTFKVVSE